jgi:hypothetical protein
VPRSSWLARWWKQRRRTQGIPKGWLVAKIDETRLSQGFIRASTKDARARDSRTSAIDMAHGDIEVMPRGAARMPQTCLHRSWTKCLNEVFQGPRHGRPRSKARRANPVLAVDEWAPRAYYYVHNPR